MATQAQAIAFINEIAPCAQNAYAHFGKVLPSVCIGMACIESGFGTSAIMRKHHAFLGQKVGTGRTATKYWDGKFFTSRTSEEYKVGQHTIIKAAFRAYDNMQQCVNNYYELLNSSIYKNVKAGAPYQTQMQQIKACGYMTSSTEVNSVLKTIKKYDLTRFDSPEASPGPAADQDQAEVKKYPTLRKGDRNEYVKAWQTFLNLNGYDCGLNDGIFGDKTLAAVKAWQKNHPECGAVDGIIGPKTWASLPII